MLHEQSHSPLDGVVGDGQDSVQTHRRDVVRRDKTIDLIPRAVDAERIEQQLGVGVGRALPVHPDAGVIPGVGGDRRVEQVVRERGVGCLDECLAVERAELGCLVGGEVPRTGAVGRVGGADGAGRRRDTVAHAQRVPFGEGHVKEVAGGVDGPCLEGHRTLLEAGTVGRRHQRDGGVFDGSAEGDDPFSDVASGIRRGDHDLVVALGKCQRRGLVGQRNHAAVEGRLQRDETGADVARLRIDRERALVELVHLEIGRDVRQRVVDTNLRGDLGTTIGCRDEVLTVGHRGGVPGVTDGRGGVGRDGERRVVVVVLAGAVAHREHCCRIVVTGRRQCAAVGQDEPQALDREVIIVLVEVDLGRGLGAGPHADGHALARGDVAERNRGGDRVPPRVDPVVEDVQDVVTGLHAVAEERVDAARLECEHRCRLQLRRPRDGVAVDADLDLGGVGVAARDQSHLTAYPLLVGDVQAHGRRVDPGKGHANRAHDRLVCSVAGNDDVFEPALAGEVGSGDRQDVAVGPVRDDLVADRLCVKVAAHGDRESLDLDVVSGPDGNLEVDAGGDLGCRLVGDLGSRGVSRHDHQSVVDLLGGDGPGRRAGGSELGLQSQVVVIDGVLNGLIGGRIVDATKVVVRAVDGESGVRGDLEPSSGGVRHPARADLEQALIGDE